jgi:hypothetical protein
MFLAATVISAAMFASSAMGQMPARFGVAPGYDGSRPQAWFYYPPYIDYGPRPYDVYYGDRWDHRWDRYDRFGSPHFGFRTYDPRWSRQAR